MDAKNQQDRAKMVEEAVGRMCRLGMMPQAITKFRKQERVDKLLKECHRIFDDKSGRNEMLAQKASKLFEEE
jgi:hypothetical protein